MYLPRGGVPLRGGVPAQGVGGTCWGVYLPGGFYLLGSGVYLPGGVPAQGVAPAWGREWLYLPGGVPARGCTCPFTPPPCEQND